MGNLLLDSVPTKSSTHHHHHHSNHQHAAITTGGGGDLNEGQSSVARQMQDEDVTSSSDKPLQLDSGSDGLGVSGGNQVQNLLDAANVSKTDETEQKHQVYHQTVCAYCVIKCLKNCADLSKAVTEWMH